jgi:hypothetical protein
MVKDLLKPQALVVLVATLVVLLVFNLSRPSLTHELQATFDTWYSNASVQLADNNGSTQQSKPVSVVIKLTSSPESTNEWKLPVLDGNNAEERARILRVLGLLSEGRVFNLPTLTSPGGREPFLSISVTDAERKFETVVSLKTVSDNIQLQNLIKLLEVFATQPATQLANPAQL